MKPIHLITIAVFIAVSIIIIAAESYQLGKNDGYEQAVKDNLFTIYPENGRISADTLIGDSVVNYMKQFRYYRIVFNTEITCHSKKEIN